jgi:WD40 repeat protein
VGFGNNSSTVSRWRVDSGGPIGRLIANGRAVVGIASDQRTLLVGTPSGNPPPFDQTYTLWDANTDTEISGMPSFRSAFMRGTKVVGAFTDGTIGSFDVVTDERHSFRTDLRSVPIATAATADGLLFALAYADSRVTVIDPVSGATVQTMVVSQSNGRQPGVGQLAIADDKKRVYVAGHGLWAFDIATGKLVARNDDESLASVGAGPPGTVVAGAVDGTLSLFDPNTLKPTIALPGANGFIQQLSVSDDGTILVGRANDGTVSLYDLRSASRLGDPIQTLADSTCNCLRLSLRSDGLQAGTTSGPTGSTSVLWNLDPLDWAKAACTSAGRNLTRQEWATYIGDLGEYRATCPEYPVPTPNS